MGLNKLQKDNMNYRLAQRLTLMEEIEGYLANAGRLVRQVEQMDRKFLESFADDGIAFPDCFTATGFKEMFDQE
ncbi:MAG: hypothetical protein H7X83_00920 [Verrucomicrobia bacterium]|nr:hypothetical protein [Deltaproteobacteria bacterium]